MRVASGLRLASYHNICGARAGRTRERTPEGSPLAGSPGCVEPAGRPTSGGRRVACCYGLLYNHDRAGSTAQHWNTSSMRAAFALRHVGGSPAHDSVLIHEFESWLAAWSQLKVMSRGQVIDS